MVITSIQGAATLHVATNLTVSHNGEITDDDTCTLAIGSAIKYAEQVLIDGTALAGHVIGFANTFVVNGGLLSYSVLDSGLGIGGGNGTYIAGGAHGGSAGSVTGAFVGIPYDSYSRPSLPGCLGGIDPIFPDASGILQQNKEILLTVLNYISNCWRSY